MVLTFWSSLKFTVHTKSIKKGTFRLRIAQWTMNTLLTAVTHVRFPRSKFVVCNRVWRSLASTGGFSLSTPVSSHIIDSLASTPVRTRYINDGKDINNKDSIIHFTELFRRFLLYNLQNQRAMRQSPMAYMYMKTLIHSHC